MITCIVLNIIIQIQIITIKEVIADEIHNNAQYLYLHANAWRIYVDVPYG